MKLNPNSDYHKALVKVYGLAGAKAMVRRSGYTAFNFPRSGVKKINDYAKRHLQNRKSMLQSS